MWKLDSCFQHGFFCKKNSRGSCMSILDPRLVVRASPTRYVKTNTTNFLRHVFTYPQTVIGEPVIQRMHKKHIKSRQQGGLDGPKGKIKWAVRTCVQLTVDQVECTDSPKAPPCLVQVCGNLDIWTGPQTFNARCWRAKRVRATRIGHWGGCVGDALSWLQIQVAQHVCNWWIFFPELWWFL